jgi:hypothetical protein
MTFSDHRFPKTGWLTESPVDVLDEHAAEVVRNRRETAQHHISALRRVMRDAATCPVSTSLPGERREGGLTRALGDVRTRRAPRRGCVRPARSSVHLARRRAR